MYDEGGQLLGDYTTQGVVQAEYVYLDTLPIAVVKSGSPAYIETDHLGTPRQVVDRTTNAVLWRWDFLGNTFGANAANASPGGGAAYPFNLRFPGQYFDAETGLHYNYFRDYEAATGRYVESDPIGLGGGASTYGYVLQSPLMLTDDWGLQTPVMCANPANAEACEAAGIAAAPNINISLERRPQLLERLWVINGGARKRRGYRDRE